MGKNKFYRILFSTLILGVLIFLAFNKHSKPKYFTYQSVIWADRAGYNVYLPATFNYHFDAKLFPDSMDVKTGSGYQLDLETGKVKTKYTYGVALLQLPFYIVANSLAPSLNMKQNGYSPIYFSALYLAAVFYLFLGMIFLRKFLRFSFSRSTVNIAISVLFLGTNLYYYSLEESGMSHVYSFFLFSFFLFVIRKTSYLQKAKAWEFVIFGLTASLIVLIRPTNLLFLSVFFFLDIKHLKEVLNRIKSLFSIRQILFIFFPVFIVWIPQLVYWEYLTGNLFLYSYGQEGFNWLNPKFIYTWFSTNNGLFLYTPMYFIFLFGLVKMMKSEFSNGVFLLSLFLVISYVFSSWWSWTFGCGFGARSYVEYLSVFVIGLCYLLETRGKNVWLSRFIFPVLVVIVALNLKMIYSYDMCFFGDGAWDWRTYFNYIAGPTK